MRLSSLKFATNLSTACMFAIAISLAGACVPGKKSVDSERRGAGDRFGAFGSAFKGGDTLAEDSAGTGDAGSNSTTISSEVRYPCELLDPTKDISMIIPGGPPIAIPVSDYVRQDGLVSGSDKEKKFKFEAFTFGDKWVLDWRSGTGAHFLHNYEATISGADTEKCAISAVATSSPEQRTVLGCFDPATRILMADHSQRRIDEIKAGDLVRNPITGQETPVVRTTIGPEAGKGLFLVGVAGKAVKVTSNHPFMTANGLRMAKDLQKTDRILAADKSFRKIETIEKLTETAGQIVVNIALATGKFSAEEHMVLADGVVSGDLFLQERLERSSGLTMKTPATRSEIATRK